MGFIPKERVNPDQPTFDKDRNVPGWDAKPGFLQAQTHVNEQVKTARNLNKKRLEKYRK